MMAAIRRLLGIRPSATFREVAAAPRDPEQERQIKAAQAELADGLLRVGRTSWAIRQELAGNALSIVRGDN